MLHVSSLWDTDYKCRIFIFFLSPLCIIFSFIRNNSYSPGTIPSPSLHNSLSPCTEVWFLPPWRPAVSSFCVTKAPSVTCFINIFKMPPCLLRWKPLPQHWTSWSSTYIFLYELFFCPHLSEFLCLLSISWRNEQVNHQLWGNFLGGAFSVIWDANIYPCSFPESHALLCIQPPHFTKKLLQLLWRLDNC